MRVLGIDCGTEKTGYGIIESDGRRHRLIAAGVVRTKPRDPLASRLLVIAEGLREVIQKHAPEVAAVEAVFHAANTKTATDRTCIMHFDFELGDAGQIDSILGTLRGIEAVYSAYRVLPGSG